MANWGNQEIVDVKPATLEHAAGVPDINICSGAMVDVTLGDGANITMDTTRLNHFYSPSFGGFQNLKFETEFERRRRTSNG